MDVFYVAQVREEGIEPSDETLLQVQDAQFESDKAWVTRNVPELQRLYVEGDTSIINAWFKGESFANPFMVTVYVECEMVEEPEKVVADENIERDSDNGDDILEPIEINL